MIGWRQNPLIRRELLYRLRPQPSQRTVIALVVFLSLLAIVLLYWAALETITDPSAYEGVLGITLIIETLLVCAGAPAATANAISREREQRTWDLLAITLLKPHEVVLGKLFGRVLPMLSIVVLGLPMLVVCVLGNPKLWFGAVLGTLVVLATLFLYSTAGLAASCFSQKTVTATALAYLFVGGWVFGTLILWGLSQILLPRNSSDLASIWLTVNPFPVVVRTVENFSGTGGGFSTRSVDQILSPWMLLAVYPALTVLLVWLLLKTYRRWAFR